MGTIDFGADTLPRKAIKLVTESASANNVVPELRINQIQSSRAQHLPICRAMTLQNGDSGWGRQSSPQKLLQLVGCRESKAVLE